MARIRLDWLIARPIAHRGLHDAARGIIENTAAAVRAAIAAGYGIEVDLHITADSEAMVHHDDVLGRLTVGEGRLDELSAAALKRVEFRGSGSDAMMTLGELCDLVAGRAPLLLELRSRFDGDGRLPTRVAAVVAGYRGPVAAMSFDPMQLRILRHQSPSLPRGYLAIQYRPHPYYDQMPAWLRYGMGSLLPALMAQPHFVAYGVSGLPAFAPLFARRVLGLPLLTWTVQTPAERQRAARWADQMIFEGFRP
jgi:glycerophosphoryl diester phosphodiesterase